MTAQTRAVLKSNFETGDIPDGDNYANLIDSFVSLSDTTAQSLSSSLEAPTVIAATVSAGTAYADTLIVKTAQVNGNVSASSGAFNTLTVNGNAVVGVGGVAKAEIYLEATATTSIGSTGVYEMIGGTFTADSNFLEGFSAKSTGEVVYQGTSDAIILVQFYLSLAAQAATTMTGMRIGKNGTTIAKSQMNRFISSADQAGAVSVGAYVEVSAGDTIAPFISNLTNGSDFDVHKCVMTAVEIG